MFGIRIVLQLAKRLLNEGRADVVVGYQAGSMPLRTQPAFVRKATGESSDLLMLGPGPVPESSERPTGVFPPSGMRPGSSGFLTSSGRSVGLPWVAR